jgi:3-dehydroquinate dehydratase-2
MILLVNGPNLNLLGEREPEVYGRETLADVERMVSAVCAGYGLEVKAFQSNWEGALIDFLQTHRKRALGVILNPGALTHTSRALADCLKALTCPTIEVHISNVHAREPWRRESFISPVARGQIVGLGIAGYHYAALYLCEQQAARVAVQDGPRAGPEVISDPHDKQERDPPPGQRASSSAASGQAVHARAATIAAPHPAPWPAPGSQSSDADPEPLEDIPAEDLPRGEYEPL